MRIDDVGELNADDEAPDWPRPSKTFTDRFSNPLFYDFADEFAPFGSDEGFDAMTELVELQPIGGSTLRDALARLHGQEAIAILEAGDIGETTELDPVVIGLAFGLIWLSGILDRDGEHMASCAVQRQIDRYGAHPTLDTLLRDLVSYRGTMFPSGSSDP